MLLFRVKSGLSITKEGYGRYVVLRHDNGLKLVCPSFPRIGVSRPIVCSSTPIALGGNTGRSTGHTCIMKSATLAMP